MRQRTVNEQAANKTLVFLKDVHVKCLAISSINFSKLYDEHRVSKSTASCMIKLGILNSVGEGYYHWIGNEPNREMALQVLELLRRRNDKMVAVPLTGFESLVDSLAIIAEGMKRQPKSSNETKENNFFTPADKKQDDLIKIVSAIAGGVYNNWNDLNDYSAINIRIVTAAQDLLTKVYK